MLQEKLQQQTLKHQTPNIHVQPVGQEPQGPQEPQGQRELKEENPRPGLRAEQLTLFSEDQALCTSNIMQSPGNTAECEQKEQGGYSGGGFQNEGPINQLKQSMQQVNDLYLSSIQRSKNIKHEIKQKQSFIAGEDQSYNLSSTPNCALKRISNRSILNSQQRQLSQQKLDYVVLTQQFSLSRPAGSLESSEQRDNVIKFDIFSEYSGSKGTIEKPRNDYQAAISGQDTSQRSTQNQTSEARNEKDSNQSHATPAKADVVNQSSVNIQNKIQSGEYVYEG